MRENTTEVVVGAAVLAAALGFLWVLVGAAGLGAGQKLKQLGASYIILEASHRVGGRGYTEEIAPGIPFDLGCHWMHSASLNPFVAMADNAGFTYRKGTYERNLHFADDWTDSTDRRAGLCIR